MMPSNQITSQLYNGEVTIDFYPDRHRYSINGSKEWPISVTAATGIVDKSRVLIAWAIRLADTHIRTYLDLQSGKTFTAEELYPVLQEAMVQHQKVKEAAADLGSQVHEFAENFAKWKLGQIEAEPQITDDMAEGVINGIMAFLDWYNTNQVEFIAAERLIYSRQYDYVGIIDVVAKVNGKLFVIDYKTGKGIYTEAYYQTAGYVLALEEETGERVDGVLILNFNKETGELLDGNIKFVPRENVDQLIDTFLACLTVKKMEKYLDKHEITEGMPLPAKQGIDEVRIGGDQPLPDVQTNDEIDVEKVDKVLGTKAPEDKLYEQIEYAKSKGKKKADPNIIDQIKEAGI